MPFLAPLVPMIATAASAAGGYIMANAIPLALSAGAAALEMKGQYDQAQAQAEASDNYAKQLEAQATQTEAVNQLEVARKARANKALLGEQRSAAAMAGFDLSDPTGALILTKSVGEMTLDKSLTLAQGKDAANQIRFQAAQQRVAGRQAKRAAKVAMATTLLKTGASWATMYGMPKGAPSATATGPVGVPGLPNPGMPSGARPGPLGPLEPIGIE
jgi:hypothetical protein